MKGKWIGKYSYSGNVSASLKNQVTNFELVIESYLDNHFSGSISDDIQSGGTKGIGSINGVISGQEITFTKQMPIKTSIFKNGTRIEEENPHRPIFYRGIIDSETQQIHGTWKFKRGIGFVNKYLAFYPGTKGKWEMKKA